MRNEKCLRSACHARKGNELTAQQTPQRANKLPAQDNAPGKPSFAFLTLSFLISHLSFLILKGETHLSSRHKSPDLYNNTRISPDGPNPRGTNGHFVSKRQVFWLIAHCKRLPKNISDIVLAAPMANYSCGTVGDFHAVPWPNALQKYCFFLTWANIIVFFFRQELANNGLNSYHWLWGVTQSCFLMDINLQKIFQKWL